MRAYFYEKDMWSGTDSFWKALGLEDRMRAVWGREKQTGSCPKNDSVRTPFVISFAGAGGKTSSIRRLAFEAMEQGFKVLVVTTTHMACPDHYGVLDGSRGEVAAALSVHGLAVAGNRAQKGKIAFTGQELYEEICPMADLVLVEADGSRRLPLKVPGTGEPVIPGNTDMILCINGLSSIGQPASDCCLRLDQARALMDQYGRNAYETEEGWRIGREDMMCLMKHGYLEPLRQHFPGVPVIPVFNQADTAEESEMVRGMLDEMGERMGLASGQMTSDRSSDLF